MSMAQKTAEELGEETQRVAAEIEREVAGIQISISDINRNTIKVPYDGHLPPEVAEIARDNGFVFTECFGTKAVFKRDN